MGTKLKKSVGTGSNYIDYSSNFVYQGGSLKYFSHPEGYVEVDGSNYKYVYKYKDHLGNVRLSYQDVSTTSTPVLEILEENNYYPFGLDHQGYGVVNNSHNALKRMFGGKELQDDDLNGNKLDWFDVGARNYDPSMARWMNMDPLTEQMRSHSPYNFAFNNPIFFQDYDGMAPQFPNWWMGLWVLWPTNKRMPKALQLHKVRTMRRGLGLIKDHGHCKECQLR